MTLEIRPASEESILKEKWGEEAAKYDRDLRLYFTYLEQKEQADSQGFIFERKELLAEQAKKVAEHEKALHATDVAISKLYWKEKKVFPGFEGRKKFNQDERSAYHGGFKENEFRFKSFWPPQGREFYFRQERGLPTETAASIKLKTMRDMVQRGILSPATVYSEQNLRKKLASNEQYATGLLENQRESLAAGDALLLKNTVKRLNRMKKKSFLPNFKEMSRGGQVEMKIEKQGLLMLSLLTFTVSLIAMQYFVETQGIKLAIDEMTLMDRIREVVKPDTGLTLNESVMFGATVIVDTMLMGFAYKWPRSIRKGEVKRVMGAALALAEKDIREVEERKLVW